MRTALSIHDVTAVRIGAFQSHQHEDGQPYYWREFTFKTVDGGEFQIAAFADNPAALPEFTRTKHKHQEHKV